MSLVSRQAFIFTIGWFTYASTYFLRKPIGVIKSSLGKDLSISNVKLGWLDTSLLLPYAVAQLAFGSIGDTFGARQTLAFSLMLSAVAMISFGWWSNFYVLCCLLLLNGLAQSQCWPNCTKVLGTWFSEKSKNTMFGLYGTCAFAGGVMGTALAVYVQNVRGWRSVHILPSLFVFAIGVIVFFCYEESSLSGYTIKEGGADIKKSPALSEQPSLKQLWFIRGVPEVSVAVFCLKVVRYCMYMWLPMFLEKQLNYDRSEAGMFSTMFEIGGVVGSAGLGLAIDRLCSVKPLLGVTSSVVLSALSLMLFDWTSHWGYGYNSVFMFLAGAFNCGPDTILGAAVPNKLGRSEGRNCASAVTGLVNGFGSIGTFIEGPIIGIIADLYGWTSMFWFMIILSLLGAIATAKASWSITPDTTTLNIV